MRYVLILFTALLLFPHAALADNANISQSSQKEVRAPHNDFFIQRDQKNDKKENIYTIQQTKQIDLSKVNHRGILLKIKENEPELFDQFQVEKLPNDAILENRNIYHVRVPENVNYQTTLRKLQQHPDVIYAEPDYTIENTAFPTGPLYEKQWYLQQMDIPKAWEITTGSRNVTIAVLDSGVNANHPDLKGRVLPGYDFVNQDHDPMDDNGHGTFVSAIIAAKADDFGMVGIDLKASILPVKITNREGNASTRNVVNGIYYAIEQGADIINMSYGNYQFSDIEEEALWEAYRQGIVLVGAAGNDGTDNWFYPASYPQVISVASTNRNDTRSEFSNYGGFVDIAAPGEAILSANYRGGHAIGDGTSYAAPMVSAIAGLIKSVHPYLSPREIEWMMTLSTENNMTDEWNPKIGYGRMNAYQALTTTLPFLQGDAPDTWEQAETIVSGEVQVDKMNLPMDADWFSFEVTQPGEVKIDIYNNSDYLDLVSGLYKVEENKLSELTTMDQGEAGEHEKFTTQLDKGKYALVIYDYYNHWSSDTYSLRVHTPGIQTGDSEERTFLDIHDHWAKSAITYLTNKGMISGYSDGTFRPDAPITRAEAATIIALEKNLADGSSTFSDVTNHHWASDYIGAITKEGIMSGYPDATFKPNRDLTREEMAVILVNAYQLKGNTTVRFPDVKSNAWSTPFIEKLVANDITDGYPDGRFLPKKKITRAEFASMIVRVLAKY